MCVDVLSNDDWAFGCFLAVSFAFGIAALFSAFSEMADKDDDLESFVGSLSCSLNLLRKNGFATQCERFDHEDEIQFLIRIPKK